MYITEFYELRQKENRKTNLNVYISEEKLSVKTRMSSEKSALGMMKQKLATNETLRFKTWKHHYNSLNIKFS